MRGPGNVAGADKEHQVARLRRGAHRFPQRLQRLDEFGLLTLGAHRLGQQQAVDAGDLRFAGAIDFRQPEFVRVRKTAREFLQQMLRARVAMGLEGDQQAAGAETLQGLQGRGNLAGVMPVIIEQAEAPIRK